MAIVSDIVYGGLRLIGIRDTSDATKMAQALTAFNEMIASWEAILHYAPTEENWTLTASTESYTIGSGGDFDTTRPIKIVSAFIRDSDNNDHPLDIITKKDYDKIYDKDKDQRATELYYAPENTLGIIYLNSAYSTAEDLYLSSVKPYPAYSALSDTLLEPIEYETALRFNFAVAIAPEYNTVPLPFVSNFAEVLKMSLVNRNFKVSKAEYDITLRRRGLK